MSKDRNLNADLILLLSYAGLAALCLEKNLFVVYYWFSIESVSFCQLVGSLLILGDLN